MATSPTTNRHRSVATERAVRDIASKLAAERWADLVRCALRSHAPEREDAVQQGLLAFIQSYPGDPADTEGAYAYLYRCVQTASWKQLRRNQRRPAVSLDRDDTPSAVSDHEASDPAELALRAESVAERRSMLEALPDELRRIAVLGAAGYSPAEISERLGLSSRQLRKRVTKINEALRRLDAG